MPGVHCVGGNQSCECTVFEEPIVFGSACAICGHARSQHKRGGRREKHLVDTGVKGVSFRSPQRQTGYGTRRTEQPRQQNFSQSYRQTQEDRQDRYGTQSARHVGQANRCANHGCDNHPMRGSLFCSGACQPSGVSFKGIATNKRRLLCGNVGCGKRAHNRTGYCSVDCMPGGLNHNGDLDDDLLDSARPGAICSNLGCNGPPLVGAAYCRRSCMPGGSLHRGIKNLGQSQPTIRTGRTGRQQQGHMASLNRSAPVGGYVRPTRREQQETARLYSQTTRATRTTRTARLPDDHPVTFRETKVREAELLTRAADAAEARGREFEAEELFIEAADIYNQLDGEEYVVEEDDYTDRDDGSTARDYDLDVTEAYAPNQLEEEEDQMLLAEAGWDQHNRRRVTDIFRKYTNDRPELTREGFEECLLMAGLRESDHSYFDAFDRHGNRSWLSARDFLIGVVGMDPHTPHTGPWRGERARMIYRFYSGGRKSLSWDGFMDLLKDAAAAGSSRSSRPVLTTARRLNPSKSPLSEQSIVRMINAGEILGAGELCRWSLLRSPSQRHNHGHSKNNRGMHRKNQNYEHSRANRQYY